MNFVKVCAILLTMAITLGACTHRPIRPQDKAMGRISKEYTSLIEKKYPSLKCDGVGAAAMTDVKKLIFGFTSREHLLEKEVIHLVCACTEELLAIVNADESIRPYLARYPFTSEDVQVGISFSDGIEESFVPVEFIASGVAYNGEVVLWRRNPITGGLKEVLAIPYSKATKEYSCLQQEL